MTWLRWLRSGRSVRHWKLTRRKSLLLLLATVATGALAFLSDFVDGVSGSLLLAVASSGASWGGLALFAGYSFMRRTSSAAAATALLVAAVLTYYGLIVVVSKRWNWGVLEDGSSAGGLGLLSAGRVTLYWVLAAACTGPFLGLLGNVTRHGTAPQRCVATGVTFGLLSAQGWHILLFRGGWRSLDDFGVQQLTQVVAIVLLSTLVMIFLARRDGLSRLWPLTVAVSVASCVCCVGLWHIAEVVRGWTSG